ncbi:MAG: hypothetical protein QM817_01350 [Archangium sp.]
MRRFVFSMLGALAFGACVKAEPVVNRAPEPVDAGPSEAELIAPKVDAIEREVLEIVRAGDEALWKAWTTGAPLESRGGLEESRAVDQQGHARRVAKGPHAAAGRRRANRRAHAVDHG